MEGKAFEATRPVYRTNDAGQRVRVMQPMHVRRDWFKDTTGTLHLMIRYGSKLLPWDRAGRAHAASGCPTPAALPIQTRN